RGLVEQKEHRIRGKRTGDFDDPLLAEGKAPRRVVYMRGKSDPLDCARSFGARARLLRAIERERRLDHTRMPAEVSAERDVVEHAHSGHELDVLKRPTDAAARDLEWRGAGNRCAAEHDVARRE